MLRLRANLNYKYTHDNPDNQYFSCRNKRAATACAERPITFGWTY